MSSLFTKIVNGDIPSCKVAEDDKFYAFLDIYPLKKGHTLVIPKKEVDYIFDLDDQLYSELHLFAKKVALAIKKAIPCERIGVVVIGLEIPHAHIHLIPIDTIGDTNFSNPKLRLNEEEMKLIAEKINNEFEKS